MLEVPLYFLINKIILPFSDDYIMIINKTGALICHLMTYSINKVYCQSNRTNNIITFYNISMKLASAS